MTIIYQLNEKAVTPEVRKLINKNLTKKEKKVLDKIVNEVYSKNKETY